MLRDRSNRSCNGPEKGVIVLNEEAGKVQLVRSSIPPVEEKRTQLNGFSHTSVQNLLSSSSTKISARDTHVSTNASRFRNNGSMHPTSHSVVIASAFDASTSTCAVITNTGTLSVYDSTPSSSRGGSSTLLKLLATTKLARGVMYHIDDAFHKSFAVTIVGESGKKTLYIYEMRSVQSSNADSFYQLHLVSMPMKCMKSHLVSVSLSRIHKHTLNTLQVPYDQAISTGPNSTTRQTTSQARNNNNNKKKGSVNLTMQSVKYEMITDGRPSSSSQSLLSLKVKSRCFIPLPLKHYNDICAFDRSPENENIIAISMKNKKVYVFEIDNHKMVDGLDDSQSMTNSAMQLAVSDELSTAVSVIKWHPHGQVLCGVVDDKLLFLCQSMRILDISPIPSYMTTSAYDLNLRSRTNISGICYDLEWRPKHVDASLSYDAIVLCNLALGLVAFVEVSRLAVTREKERYDTYMARSPTADTTTMLRSAHCAHTPQEKAMKLISFLSEHIANGSIVCIEEAAMLLLDNYCLLVELSDAKDDKPISETKHGNATRNRSDKYFAKSFEFTNTKKASFVTKSFVQYCRQTARRCVQFLLAKEMVHAATKVSDKWLSRADYFDPMHDCYSFGIRNTKYTQVAKAAYKAIVCRLSDLKQLSPAESAKSSMMLPRCPMSLDAIRIFCDRVQSDKELSNENVANNSAAPSANNYNLQSVRSMLQTAEKKSIKREPLDENCARLLAMDRFISLHASALGSQKDMTSIIESAAQVLANAGLMNEAENAMQMKTITFP